MPESATPSQGDGAPVMQIDVPLRVRYAECDPMGVAHHSAYTVWLEIARTELLRAQGGVYRDMEANGIFFVVARLSLRYRQPAKYDDQLTIHVAAEPTAGVKIEHRYEVRRGRDKLATAESTIVCVDADGKLQPVPQGLLP
ncbi:MAG: acyl-CoA thioesterase [Planctomycetota bacterium]